MLISMYFIVRLSLYKSLTRRGGFCTTKRACGQVGHLKLLCPNVSRYNLLFLSYLLMFKRFPSAETKRGGSGRPSTVRYKIIPKVEFYSVRPTCHKPMLSAVLFFVT